MDHPFLGPVTEGKIEVAACAADYREDNERGFVDFGRGGHMEDGAFINDGVRGLVVVFTFRARKTVVSLVLVCFRRSGRDGLPLILYRLTVVILVFSSLGLP